MSALNETYQISVVGSFLGQSHYNIFYYSIYANTGEGVTTAELAANWQTVYKEDYLNLFHTGFTLHGLIVKRVLPSLGLLFESGITGDAVGTITGNPAESYVAGVWATRSATATKRGRGRFYIGGQSEDNTDTTDGNSFSTGYRTLMQTWADLVIQPWEITGAFGTATLTWAVYSKLDAVARPVIQCLPSRRPATMRSRKYRGLVGA